MADRKIYRIHDSVIAALARVLQQALLTGTDISDHMRMMRLEEMRDDPDTLVLTPEYLEQENATIERMLDDAERLQGEDADKDEELYEDIPDDSVVMVGDGFMTGDGDEHGPN